MEGFNYEQQRVKVTDHAQRLPPPPRTPLRVKSPQMSTKIDFGALQHLPLDTTEGAAREPEGPEGPEGPEEARGIYNILV